MDNAYFYIYDTIFVMGGYLFYVGKLNGNKEH